MTKSAFLAELSGRLTALPQSEIEKSVAYYSEIIDDRIEEGLDEEAAVNGLESPAVIAGRILQETPISVLVKERIRPKKTAGAWSVVLIVLGFPVWFPLLMAAFAVILSVYIVVWSVVLVFFSVVFALGLAAVAAFAATPFLFSEGTHMGLAALGAAFFCAGACIFAFFASRAVTRGVIGATARIGRKIKSKLIRGGRSNEERN